MAPRKMRRRKPPMTSLRILVLAGFALLTIWPRGDDVAVWTEKRHRATAGMHQATVAAVFDPAILEERESELRRDLDRFERERDEKIKRVWDLT